MPVSIGRRELIAALGGAAAWPIIPRALAQSRQPVIGFLNDLPPGQWPRAGAAFSRGLGDAGYVEGRNVAFTHRWTAGHRDRLPALAADLVRADVTMIVTSGHTAAAMAARAATSTVPVVFVTADDPVKFGLVGGLDKPGGNATGMYLESPHEQTSARQNLLRQLVPRIQVFFQIRLFDASSNTWETEPEEAIAKVFATTRTFDGKTGFIVPTVRTLTITSDPFLDGARRRQFVALVARRGIPAVYDWREFTEAGGLMSYGASLEDVYSRLGGYAGRILQGEQPADLPVLKPTKSETIINFSAVRTLGLDAPSTLLDRADEVID